MHFTLMHTLQFHESTSFTKGVFLDLFLVNINQYQQIYFYVLRMSISAALGIIFGSFL